jgi:diketogulonate reductase-like aldo/keto reductase
VREICARHKIIYQGFSLLTANIRVLESASVRAVAKELRATAAQVIFKFSKQIGMLPLTGTTSREHMLEDLQSDDVNLSAEYVRMIESIALAN